MLVSMVVPVYNEASVLPEFYRLLRQTLDTLPHETEIWFVDDGSTDATADIVRELMTHDGRVRLLELSRNFGHQVALAAGLDFADGDAVICMDGDGQHPPELIPEMVALYEQGFDVVLTQRSISKESWLRRWTTRTFYRLNSLLSATPVLPYSSDFRLVSRQVVLGLRQFREHHRFLRGLISWMGFQRAVLTFDQPPRIAGKSKYSLRKLWRLASDGIFYFSTVPMKLAILAGCVCLLLAFWQLAYAVSMILMGRRAELVPGWTLLMLSVLGVGGVQLIMLGVVGQYVGLIFQEVKRRPLYFLRRAPTSPAARKEPVQAVNDES
jgi:glycosyltransferase involved in cell wall biosynthesis